MLRGAGRRRARARARTRGQLRLTDDARELWHAAYPHLSAPQPGIAGQVNARGEAHTIRLALTYALINGAAAIAPCHLHAALALHDYAARSATWALDPTTTDPFAEQIHSALKHAPDGLTRTQLRDLFHRNPASVKLDQALAALADSGKASPQRILTAGRPAQLWTATPGS